MLYEKDKEHKLVAQTMFFVDKYSDEIPRCISYDDSTSIAVVSESEDGMVTREKYMPGSMCIVDKKARPNENDLGNIREKYTRKRDREK
jgi:hypothetical protein